MWRFMFSGVIIILVGLSFGAFWDDSDDEDRDYTGYSSESSHEGVKKASSSPYCKALLEAILTGSDSAEYLARQVGSQCVTGIFDIENNERYDEALPLHFIALMENRENVAIILFQEGANVYEADGAGNTSLHLATLHNLNRAFTNILEKMNNDVIIWGRTRKQQQLDRLNDDGETALHIAVKLENVNMVTRLRDEGAKSDICRGDGKTALRLAIARLNHTGSQAAFTIAQLL